MKSINESDSPRNVSDSRVLSMPFQPEFGVIGGMGPRASALFRTKLAQLPFGKDQEHPILLEYSIPKIDDRTGVILSGNQAAIDQVGQTLGAAAAFLEKSGARFVVIPCNTAHYWADVIEKNLQHASLLNMVTLTCEHIALQYSSVGILATKGTLKTELYQKVLTERGLTVLLPSKSDQDEVMELIMSVKGSIDPASLFAQLREVIHRLGGPDCVILGCTELPLITESRPDVGVPLIDPMAVLVSEISKKLGVKQQKQ